MWPHELKLSRARQHLEKLEAEVDRWIHLDGCSVHVKPDPKPPNYVVTARILRPPDEAPLAVLIGDVLQNARSALEYLAYSLAEEGARARGKPLTDREIEQTSFPVIGDVDRDGFSGRGPDLFATAAAQKLTAMTPEARAVIKRLQPFYEAPAWDLQPLWILNELARIDRHRFLHLAAIRTGGLRLDPAKSRNVKVLGDLEVLNERLFPEFEDRADLARLTAFPANPQEGGACHSVRHTRGGSGGRWRLCRRHPPELPLGSQDGVYQAHAAPGEVVGLPPACHAGSRVASLIHGWVTCPRGLQTHVRSIH